MSKKRKLLISLMISLILVLGLMVTYALFMERYESSNQVLLTGDVYIRYVGGTPNINLTNSTPMTMEEALEQENNVFNFQINGKNTSDKPIYYGISVIHGEDIDGKIRIADRDIDVYLEEVVDGGDNIPLINGERYSKLSGTNMYVGIVEPNTNSYSKTYSLRVWIDEGVVVYGGDLTGEDGSYSDEEWPNCYVSLKVKIDANMKEMNVPLAISSSPHDTRVDNFLENGKSFFITEIKNFLDPNEEGDSLTTPDDMNLKVTSSNPDIRFSYTVLNNGANTTISNQSDYLDLDYQFNTKLTKQVKVFVENIQDYNIDSDIKIVLTKNNTEVYDITRRVTIKGNNYCLNNGYNLHDCLLVSEIKDLNEPQEKTVRTAKSAISGKGEVNVDNIAANGGDLGLYKTRDNDGDTYFYRGAVTNNHVKFGGYYWRIVRINGDGSIRLIYNGTDPETIGSVTNGASIENSAYNDHYADPAHVGYMYGNDYSTTDILSSQVSFTNLGADTVYYFAKAYTYDSVNRWYHLVVTTENTDYIKKKVSEMTDALYAEYPYMCPQASGTSDNANCQLIVKGSHTDGATSMRAQYITRSHTSYAKTVENTASSNIKTAVDNWYVANIVGKTNSDSDLTNGIMLEDYIDKDAIFCNDRTVMSGDGFRLAPNDTYYAGRNRLVASSGKTANLVCSQAADKFSKTTTKGNGKLSYPVALITADEVALAGGKYNTANSDYYLRTNGYYWTMTPSHFLASYAHARVWRVHPAGGLYDSLVDNRSGVRAVINLKSDVLISSGNGSSTSPYEIRLK